VPAVKTNKLNDYKKMTIEGLEKELKELKQELFKLRFSHAMNGLDNPNKIGEAKKNIARVNTIITMKKAGKEMKIYESAKASKKTKEKEATPKAEVKEKATKPAKTVKKKSEETEKKETKGKGGKN
jgi:large subunit ribosomal protein L29